MAQTALKLAVLISGSGTTLENLVAQISQGKLSAAIPMVIASRQGIAGIDKASAAHLPCRLIERKQYPSVADFSRDIFHCCERADADLICLAGWLSLLEIPSRWQGKIMNIHPALLPSFGGKDMFGLRVHRAVLEHGCKISGCTVHFVNQEYDSGPIVLQRACPVLEDDTPETLAHRVFAEEKIAYPQAISLYQQGRLHIHGRTVRISPSI